MEVNIAKKHLYLLSAIFVFILGVGIVIANDSSPSELGHSIDEINWNQEVQKVNVQEICIPDSLAENCKTTLPTAALTAGEGIEITPETIPKISLKEPRDGVKGGVHASSCPSGQLANEIDSNGNLGCSADLTS